MISFNLRYDEHTMLWQYRPEGLDRWSEPMRYGKAVAAIAREIKRDSLEAEGKADDLHKRWSMPLPHQAKAKARSQAAADVQLYEIRGGKVQKIGYTERERTAQQAEEILALLEELDND